VQETRRLKRKLPKGKAKGRQLAKKEAKKRKRVMLASDEMLFDVS